MLRDDSGPAIWQCLSCDDPDPLKSERVEGWIKSPPRHARPAGRLT